VFAGVYGYPQLNYITLKDTAVNQHGVMNMTERLRKVSDTVFQEAEPPKDRSRPLEWRRGFKRLYLDLLNVEVFDICNVNQVDKNLRLSKDENKADTATANPSYFQSIRAEVDHIKFRDRLLFSVPEEKNGEVFFLERAKGKIQIIIKAGDKGSYKKDLIGEVYAGEIGRANYEPGKDDIYLELLMPSENLDRLTNTFLAFPKSSLRVDVDVLAFTYEVDDAFREWHHSREMFIEGDHGIALLSSVGIVRSGEKTHSYGDDEDGNEYANHLVAKNTSDTKFLSLEKCLRGIKNAIYVAVVMLAILALK